MNPREQQTEDLKAFEQRLTESVSNIHASAKKWRMLVAGVMLWLVYSLWCWWNSEEHYDTLWDHLKGHIGLTLCLSVILSLTLFGVCERARAAKIVAGRCRNVLKSYNMSCDEHGKLILKRTPRQPLLHGDEHLQL